MSAGLLERKETEKRSPLLYKEEYTILLLKLSLSPASLQGGQSILKPFSYKLVAKLIARHKLFGLPSFVSLCPLSFMFVVPSLLLCSVDHRRCKSSV